MKNFYNFMTTGQTQSANEDHVPHNWKLQKGFLETFWEYLVNHTRYFDQTCNSWANNAFTRHVLQDKTHIVTRHFGFAQQGRFIKKHNKLDTEAS